MLKKTLLILSLVLASAASVASAALPKNYGDQVYNPQGPTTTQALPKNYGE